MRLLAFLFLLGFSSVPANAANFKYELADTDREVPFRATMLLQFQTAIRDLGYDPITFNLQGNHNFLFVDQIFENFSRTRRIFLKLGLKPDSKELMNSTQKIAAGFVYHSEYSQTPFALYFEGFDKKSANKISVKIKENLAFEQKSSSSNFSLFETANASSMSCSNVNIASEDISAIESSVGGINLMTALQDCVVSALNGVVDGARGLASGTANFIRNLATNPAELWRGVSSQFQRLREVVGSLHSSIAGAISSFDGLPPEVTKAILCGMVGAMAPQILRALSPAGAAALSAVIAGAVQKVVTMVRNLKRLMPNIPTPDARRAWATKAGTCAVR